MTTIYNVVILSIMKARLLLDRRVVVAAATFAELKLWLLPAPLRGSKHQYKYRLALVVDRKCILRYDNESGKGDHNHVGGVEERYAFSSPDRLIKDFFDDVARWQDENSDT